MIPKTVSHYEVLEKLGGGGMGVVYKARDTRLDRIVALKFLPLHASDNPVAQERFFQEAKAASALDHRNICTIHDFGSSDEGEPFIAMAYYPGETLKRKLDRGPLPVAEALDVAIQMAEGLARAHEAGIVHRDVKPANAIVTDRGEVKLLDFGLAKLPDKSMTATGTLMGTAAYMSPEQVRGEKVDHRTDVWSLGVVLYEMLKGEAPFRGESSPTLLRAIEQETPPSLDEAPSELSRVVERALEKDPARRYRSMTELLGDLDAARLALGFSDPSSAPTMAALAPPRRRSNRGYAVAAAAAVVALGAFAYFNYQRSARARWAREEALPEIERLVNRSDSASAWSAMELLLEAGKAIPSDPALQRLWPTVARDVTLESEPPGAEVYAKPYSSPEREWVNLGRSPLRDVRIPLGFARLKMEMEGRRTVEDVLRITDSGESEWLIELPEAGALPDEMVSLPSEMPPVRLAGLDYLEAEQLTPYLMDRYEVTNREFKRFIEAGGYEKDDFWKEPFVRDGRTLSWAEAMSLFKDKTGRPGPATWEVGDYPAGQGDHPVSGVSWYEAVAYAVFAGKSLPTIFHWNHAAFARAAAEVVPLSNLASKGTKPVGSSSAMNRRGTHDLAGNVREWCWNRAGTGAEELRFILGGGWNDPTYAFTDAYAQSPWDRSIANGFRCIRPSDNGENVADLGRDLELPFRDYTKETPVPDETFQVYLSQYAYDRTDLSATVESEREHEDWTVEKVSFIAAYGGERMFAYLFLPKKASPPFQTVVYFPGSNVISARSSEFLLTSENLYFDFVFKSGRALMFPIYKGTYERGDGLKDDYPGETSFYKDHVIMWLKDYSRSIDYLETREDIDSDRLAYFGVSWGGGMGAIVPAVETRLDAVVLYVAGLYFQKALPEVDGINYVTRVRQPTIMINGEYDFFFPLETSQRPMFELLGTPEKDKKWKVFPGSHSVPREDLIRETLDWLDKYLGPVS